MRLGIWRIPGFFFWVHKTAPLLDRLIYRLGGRGFQNDQIDGSFALRQWLFDATEAGARFDLPFKIENESDFKDAVSKGRGVVLVGVHMAANPVIHRYIYDQGYRSAVIRFKTEKRLIWGTAAEYESIQKDESVLFKAKRLLAGGGLFIVNFDRGQQMSRGRKKKGKINTNIFKWAALLRVPVVFFACRPDVKGYTIRFSSFQHGEPLGPALAAFFNPLIRCPFPEDLQAGNAHWELES